MVKALRYEEPWVIWYKSYLQTVEFKDFKGWADVELEDKLMGGWDLEVKGPIYIKSMWVAWRVSKELLDLRKFSKEGEGFKKGCIWLFPKKSLRELGYVRKEL